MDKIDKYIRYKHSVFMNLEKEGKNGKYFELAVRHAITLKNQAK